MRREHIESEQGAKKLHIDEKLHIDDKKSDKKQDEHRSKKNKFTLAKDEKCAQDVAKFCSKVKKDNNFAVFICLQEAIQVNFRDFESNL